MTAFNNKLDIGSKTEWCTPRFIVEALGRFDLDPCAPVKPPYKLAGATFNINTDGLKSKWPEDARIFLNPPYDRNLERWLKKMYEHPGGGIALIFARTDTKYFQRYCFTAHAILFLNKRVTFLHVDGRCAERNSGAPSVLVAYSERDAEILRTCGLAGKFIRLKGESVPVSQRLIAASERALQVLEEICHPTLTHMPEDEEVRDELKAALQSVAQPTEAAPKLICSKCGKEVFWLLTVVTNVRVVSNTKLTFDAPDATENINGLRCFECDRSNEVFGGTWKVEAVGFELIEGEEVV